MPNLWIFFTDIGENGIAFSQYEVSILDDRYLSEWINLEIILSLVFKLAHVDRPALVRNTTYI
jgi:hypothetical protein